LEAFLWLIHHEGKATVSRNGTRFVDLFSLANFAAAKATEK
jgi:hypothetical protein